jgi:hypothetical protein
MISLLQRHEYVAPNAYGVGYLEKKRKMILASHYFAGRYARSRWAEVLVCQRDKGDGESQPDGGRLAVWEIQNTMLSGAIPYGSEGLLTDRMKSSSSEIWRK